MTKRWPVYTYSNIKLNAEECGFVTAYQNNAKEIFVLGKP
jgi:hypothetical protein